MKLVPDHTALRHCEDGSLEGEVEMWPIGNVQIRERTREIHCVTEARITSHRIIFSMDSSALGCICLRDFMCAWCIGGNYIALVPIIRRVVGEVYLRIARTVLDDVFRVLTDVFKTRPWLKGSYEPDSVAISRFSSICSVPTTSDLSHLLPSFNHSTPPTPRPVASLQQHMMHPHFRVQQQLSDGRASHCGTDGSGSCAAGSEVTHRDAGDLNRLGDFRHGQTITPSVSWSTQSDPPTLLPALGDVWRERENPELGDASEVASESGVPCFTLFSQHSLFDIDALCSSPSRAPRKPVDEEQDLEVHRPAVQLQELELEHHIHAQQHTYRQQKKHPYKQKLKYKQKPDLQHHAAKLSLPNTENQVEQPADQREERQKPQHRPQLRPHHQPHAHHQTRAHHPSRAHHQSRSHHRPYTQGQYLPDQEHLPPFLVPQQDPHQMPVMDTLLNTLNACWTSSQNDLSSYPLTNSNQADVPLQPSVPVRPQQNNKALRHASTANEQMHGRVQLAVDAAIAMRAPHDYFANDVVARTKDKITASAWSYRKKAKASA